MEVKELTIPWDTIESGRKPPDPSVGLLCRLRVPLLQCWKADLDVAWVVSCAANLSSMVPNMEYIDRFQRSRPELVKP